MECVRGPLRPPRELLNDLGSLDMESDMGSTVEGVIDLLRLCCVVGVTNTDILKLCGVHIDLMCPNKMWSTIILLILLKCYKSQQ